MKRLSCFSQILLVVAYLLPVVLVIIGRFVQGLPQDWTVYNMMLFVPYLLAFVGLCICLVVKNLPWRYLRSWLYLFVFPWTFVLYLFIKPT